MTKGLQIPTTQLTVELALLGGERRRVGLFLAGQEQHLIDVLEGEQQFLPAVSAADESWSLLNKRAIVWVSIGLVDGHLPIEESDDNTLYDLREQVEVELVGGLSVVGELLYTPPPGQGRLTDHLNARTQFFRVWTADSLFIVNKEHVLGLSLPEPVREDS